MSWDVLILVLMEDALRGEKTSSASTRETEVLILVLMEDALRVEYSPLNSHMQ